MPPVKLVAGGADPRHQLAVVEHRAHGGEVGVVDGTQVGVVADEDVAVPNARVGVRQALRALDDERQHVALGHDVRAHGHQGAIGQHDRGRGIVAGDQHIRARAAHVLDAHLLRDRQQAVVQHLEGDRVHVDEDGLVHASAREPVAMCV
jgi:hypothetical protein